MTRLSEHQKTDILNAYTTGISIHEIASTFDIPITDILIVLQEIYETLKESVLLKFDDATALALYKIDKTESEAWRSWELSKRPKIKKNQKATKLQAPNSIGDVGSENVAESPTPPVAQKIEQQMHSEEREGNPTYLNIIINCVKMRKELLNL